MFAYGTTVPRGSCCSPKHITEHLNFPKEHTDPPQSYWEHVLQTYETKVELFEKNTQLILCKKGTVQQHEKHHHNSEVWRRFGAALDLTACHHEKKTNPQVYEGMLQNLRVAAHQLKISRNQNILFCPWVAHIMML